MFHQLPRMILILQEAIKIYIMNLIKNKINKNLNYAKNLYKMGFVLIRKNVNLHMDLIN